MMEGSASSCVLGRSPRPTSPDCQSVMVRQKPLPAPGGNRDWGPATRDLRREYRLRFRHKKYTQ